MGHNGTWANTLRFSRSYSARDQTAVWPGQAQHGWGYSTVLADASLAAAFAIKLRCKRLRRSMDRHHGTDRQVRGAAPGSPGTIVVVQLSLRCDARRLRCRWLIISAGERIRWRLARSRKIGSGDAVGRRLSLRRERLWQTLDLWCRDDWAPRFHLTADNDQERRQHKTHDDEVWNKRHAHGNPTDTPAFRSARHDDIIARLSGTFFRGAERRSASANYSRCNRERRLTCLRFSSRYCGLAAPPFCSGAVGTSSATWFISWSWGDKGSPAMNSSGCLLFADRQVLNKPRSALGQKRQSPER